MSRARLLSFVGVLAALALVAAAVWTGLSVRDVRADRDADREALAAGREAAVAFTSYDYQRLEADLARVTDQSTGTFKDQFTAALGALTEAITTAQGASVGTVAYAGLRERSGETATVLAAVDAQITNTNSPEPSTRRYRLQISLDSSSGDWLIADITPVS